MSRALMKVLAITPVVVIVLVQSHIALAYHGMGPAPQSPAEVEVMVAYVDPGAAGFIIVSVLGFISAVGYMARAYIGKLKRMVLRGEREVQSRREQRGRCRRLNRTYPLSRLPQTEVPLGIHRGESTTWNELEITVSYAVCPPQLRPQLRGSCLSLSSNA